MALRAVYNLASIDLIKQCDLIRGLRNNYTVMLRNERTRLYTMLLLLLLLTSGKSIDLLIQLRKMSARVIPGRRFALGVLQ